MHARDLVKSPKKPNPEGPKRKAPTKVPSWHLTGDKAMQNITDANKRQEERREKEKKYETARKQAVSKVKTEEQKLKPKVTHLTAPRLNPQSTKWVKHQK